MDPKAEMSMRISGLASLLQVLPAAGKVVNSQYPGVQARHSAWPITGRGSAISTTYTVSTCLKGIGIEIATYYSEPGAVGLQEGENGIDGESHHQPNFCRSASKGIALQVKEQGMTTTLNFARRAEGKSPAQRRLHQVRPTCIEIYQPSAYS